MKHNWGTVETNDDSDKLFHLCTSITASASFVKRKTDNSEASG